jgi:hypothetical protein
LTASSSASGVLRAYVPVTLWIVWPSRSEMSYSCTCRPRNSVTKVRRRSCQITPPSTVRPNDIRARSHVLSKPRRIVVAAREQRGQSKPCMPLKDDYAIPIPGIIDLELNLTYCSSTQHNRAGPQSLGSPICRSSSLPLFS